jgi:hypothetical protein
MDRSPREAEARDQLEVTFKFQKNCIYGWTLLVKEHSRPSPVRCVSS